MSTPTATHARRLDAPVFERMASPALFGERPSLRWRIAVLLLGGACVALGMLWLDPLVYRFSKQHLDTVSPFDQDFYLRTRLFWKVFRLPGTIEGGMLAYAIIGLLHRGGWRTATRGFCSVVGADLLTLMLQFAFGRARPNQSASHLDFRGPIEAFHEEGVGCFPSGEATASFALACVLSYIYPRGRPIFWTLAVINAAARLVPGAHYVSDVCGGAALGSVVAATLYWRLERPFAPPPVESPA